MALWPWQLVLNSQASSSSAGGSGHDTVAREHKLSHHIAANGHAVGRAGVAAQLLVQLACVDAHTGEPRACGVCEPLR
jgi:hypothetical protein